jgi:hypothetical protein
MLVKCIKDYKDEYGFIYSVGKTYQVNATRENSPWLYRHIPGAGPMGTLAICTLIKENFILIEENRDNRLNQLGIV